MEGSGFKVVVARSSEDPEEHKEKSKFNSKKSVNEKLPCSTGPNKPKFYVEEEHWGMVLDIVQQEMALRNPQAVNSYAAKADVAFKVRVALNQKMGKEDHFTVLVLGADSGLGHWSLGPFLVVKVGERFTIC